MADLRRFTKEWQVWAAAASLAVVLLSVVPAVAAHPRVNFDSGSYLALPSLKSGRLPVVPLLFAILGHDLRAISIIQAVGGAFCWCFLLSEIARTPRRVVRLLALISVTAIACSTYVVQWYAAILSDSVSISLLALIVGLLARWRRLRSSTWPLVLATAAWAMTRPTNAYILLITAVILAPVSLVKNRRELPKITCVLIVSLTATYLAGQGQLWQQPFLHSVTERILPNPSLRTWFAGHGMPRTQALQKLSGPYYPSVDHALRYSPALSSFRAWTDRSGKAVFVQFLATHIPWAVKGTFSRHEELRPSLIAYYGGGIARPWYPATLRNLFLTGRQPELLIMLGANLAACAVLLIRRTIPQVRDPLLVWGSVIALGFLTLTIDWAGDSWEVGRHSVDGTITVALASIMLLVGLSSHTSPREAPDTFSPPHDHETVRATPNLSPTSRTIHTALLRRPSISLRKRK